MHCRRRTIKLNSHPPRKNTSPNLNPDMTPVIRNDGEVWVDAQFLPADPALALLDSLIRSLHWQQEQIRLYGRNVISPRRVCWIGDPGAVYSYSGIRHEPMPWPRELDTLREQIGHACGHRFNSVLANLYRDGNDSMGWHADREAELGPCPVLASLSLGESRIFRLRHKRTGETHSLEPGNGCLIVMRGELQQHWRHCVPRTRRPKSARINLSFRRIVRQQD